MIELKSWLTGQARFEVGIDHRILTDREVLFSRIQPKGENMKPSLCVVEFLRKKKKILEPWQVKQEKETLKASKCLPFKSFESAKILHSEREITVIKSRIKMPRGGLKRENICWSWKTKTLELRRFVLLYIQRRSCYCWRQKIGAEAASVIHTEPNGRAWMWRSRNLGTDVRKHKRNPNAVAAAAAGSTVPNRRIRRNGYAIFSQSSALWLHRGHLMRIDAVRINKVAGGDCGEAGHMLPRFLFLNLRDQRRQ